MAPLIVLLTAVAILRLVAVTGVEALESWQTCVRGGLALMLLMTGLAHFLPLRRDQLVQMVPERLPAPGTLVTVTGVLELAAAAGLLVPRLAPWAAGGLVLLLLAMFPANVSAASRGLSLGRRPVLPLPLRTALQVAFVAAAVYAV